MKLEKLKQDAMEWYEKKQPSIARATKKKQDNNSEDSIKQELAIIKQLKKIIANSELERKAILLEAMSTAEYKLKKGKMPENLPSMVEQLTKKEDIKDQVINTLKQYKLNNIAYYDLWIMQ